jgi:hypothetical protein
VTERLHRRREVAAEVAALEADDADRQEMLDVASLMESLRAPAWRPPAQGARLTSDRARRVRG